VAHCALLDANVLHPILLCDVLLRFAEKVFFRPLWSRDILDETTRSVARRFPDIPPERLERRVSLMNEAFPEALVSGYERLADTLQLGEDAHVLAAAVIGGADVIVNDNVRDFADATLEQYRLHAQTADDFLVHQWWLDPEVAARVISEQSTGTRRPHLPVADLLDRLSRRLANL